MVVDGIATAIPTCTAEELALCVFHASCAPASTGSVVRADCTCKDGYSGDGRIRASGIPNVVGETGCSLDVDCAGRWGAWSGCSLTCAGGTRTREYIVTTAAVAGGEACPSDGPQSEACNEAACGPC
jgi:hypothetical protein